MEKDAILLKQVLLHVKPNISIVKVTLQELLVLITFLPIIVKNVFMMDLFAKKKLDNVKMKIQVIFHML